MNSVLQLRNHEILIARRFLPGLNVLIPFGNLMRQLLPEGLRSCHKKDPFWDMCRPGMGINCWRQIQADDLPG